MDKDQELLFPTKGLDLSLEFDRQPGDTTVYARNVRTNDRIEFRDRGGSRAGLSKYIATQPGSSTPPDPHTIVTASNNGAGVVLFVTAAPHGLTGGELVTVTGCSEAAYNKAALNVDGVPTAASFETGDLAFVGNGTGGTWSL